MKIPAGTTRRRTLRLKGRGIPGKPPGDMYVELAITLPAAESDKAKSLYAKMREELNYDPRKNLGG